MTVKYAINHEVASLFKDKKCAILTIESIRDAFCASPVSEFVARWLINGQLNKIYPRNKLIFGEREIELIDSRILF